jgi:uncharacterized protein (TIGR00369 family)
MSDCDAAADDREDGEPDEGPAEEPDEYGDAPAALGEDFFVDGTFNDWVGLRVEEYGDGRVVLAVDREDFKDNPGGIMHGGVTATLIDVAGGLAIGSTFEGDPMMATTSLDVEYLRPITDTAYATAEVVRVGNTNGVARVDVESTAPDGERKRVAIGTVTYQLP